MKSTNIRLKITGGEKIRVLHPDHYRVKIDGKGFPYIILNNEKVIINSSVFPRTLHSDFGQVNYEINIIEGVEELNKILSNPELTVDKLTNRDLFRIG